MPGKTLRFIFINGKGGSGKDTQADRILEMDKDQSVRISTGDIYRGARDKKEPYARYHEAVAPFVHHVDIEGGYLPDEVIVPIVGEVILELADKGKETFLFTGFPRTEGQLSKVDAMLLELGQNFEISQFHIYYSLSNEISRKRSEGRRNSDIKAGRPPRRDDDPEAVEKRLATFENLTKPMIERLADNGRLIEIDASGTIESIKAETSSRISRERE